MRGSPIHRDIDGTDSMLTHPHHFISPLGLYFLLLYFITTNFWFLFIFLILETRNISEVLLHTFAFWHVYLLILHDSWSLLVFFSCWWYALNECANNMILFIIFLPYVQYRASFASWYFVSMSLLAYFQLFSSLICSPFLISFLPI